MTSGSTSTPSTTGEMMKHSLAFTALQALGDEEPAGPRGGRECNQEHSGYWRGFLGESLEGEGTNHFPKGPTITCRKQRCIKGYRKSGRGQPEEIDQSRVGFMPGGFRTNQAHPF